MGMLHQSVKCHHEILREFYPARAFIFLLLLIILWAGDSPAYGSDQTTAGVVAARSASNTSILVRMPYTGDDNGNNTYTVEYQTCASGSYSPWVVNAPHAASPFITTITGLSENTCYDIRATYSDADGVAGALTQTVRISLPWDNTLIHNINRFGGSTKWNGEGGWGLPGTKYGQFVCETCHVTMAPNIKGIRGSISAPNGTDQFPGQAGGSGVLFQSTIAPNGFGDDTGGHATSQKICEYCHIQTGYHRYNTTGQSRLDHNNNTDCSSCHPHSAGFYFATNACDACHGNPPTADITGGPNGLASAPPTGSAKAGAHALHATAAGRNYSCDICHYNSVGSGTTHRDASISIGFVNILGSGTYTGGAYDGQSSANYLPTDTGTSVAKTGAKTCSSIYCHGSTMASNNGTNTTPEWDKPATASCGTCHGATTADPPYLGAHFRHAGPSTDIGHDYSCAICHDGLVPSTIPSNMSTHVNNKSEVVFSSDPKVAGAIYSGTDTMLDSYGNCSNVYCHSNVQTSPPGGALTYKSVNWNDQFASDPNCNLCHGGSTDHYSAPRTGNTTGSHTKHAQKNIYCAACHANDITQDPTGCIVCHTVNGPNVTHANYSIDVNMVNMYGGTYSGSPTPGDLYGSCSNVYCHSIGQNDGGSPLVKDSANYKNPPWGGSVVCGDCHRSDGSQGTGTLMNSGSHLLHVTSKPCSSCHNGAGSGTSKHINNLIEVAFTADPFANTPSYSQSPNTPGNAYGSCSTVYCHSIGQREGGTALVAGTSDYMTPSWGETPGGCGSCHRFLVISGSHTPHLNLSYNCVACHNNAGNNTTKHADKNIDVEFDALSGVTGTYSQNPNPPGNGYGSCSNTNCHGTTSPQWGTNLSAEAPCNKCHGSAASAAGGTFKATSGNTAPTDTKVGAHVAHLASTHNMTSDIACTECHAVPANVNDPLHIDTALPAELTWGTLATKGGAVSPNYAGGSCSAVYCHGNGLTFPGGANKTPIWNDTTYLAGTTTQKCGQCHGYPPGGTHTPLTNCAQCHTHVNVTNDGFVDVTKHVNFVIEIADNCIDCHASMSATHTKHSDPNTVLAGKRVSAGDYGQSWFYGVSYVNGMPKYSCGYCHPSSVSTHMNGTNNLNLDPADPNATGTVKAKNGTPNFTQTPGTSVTCSSVYCHSNGFTPYAYKTTPNWFGGAFAGDGCAACHGNSPNSGGNTGSPAHGAHVVGIHYNDLYSGSLGKLAASGVSGAAHGDPSTSTTINCNVCHKSTVAVAYNDTNTVCVTCHTGAAVKGSMVISTTSTSHINGTPDVSFGTFSVKSKSQVRDSITSVAELNNSWTRTNGYKSPSSFDASKRTPTYTGGSCSSVDCHNGNNVSWSAGTLSCTDCHKDLP